MSLRGKYQTIHDANALVSIHTALHFQMDNNGRKEQHHGYNDGAWYDDNVVHSTKCKIKNGNAKKPNSITHDI